MPISGRIWVFGVSFAHTGIDTEDFTAETIARTMAGSFPTSIPYPFAWGQERFSSTALAP